MPFVPLLCVHISDRYALGSVACNAVSRRRLAPGDQVVDLHCTSLAVWQPRDRFPRTRLTAFSSSFRLAGIFCASLQTESDVTTCNALYDRVDARAKQCGGLVEWCMSAIARDPVIRPIRSDRNERRVKVSLTTALGTTKQGTKLERGMQSFSITQANRPSHSPERIERTNAEA